MSDEEIVARVVAGERSLFEILIRRHNQRMYRTVLAVLGENEGAEDAMQEAYLSAYRHLPQFAGRSSFSTWLTRIAVHEALARRHTTVRERMRSEDTTMLELIEADEPNPEKQAVSSELRELLQNELARLDVRYRTVVMLRDVEGLSTAETASCLDISEDLVKTRLHRGRTMLRDRLFNHSGRTLHSLFEFGNARCDRVVSAVMARITSS